MRKCKLCLLEIDDTELISEFLEDLDSLNEYELPINFEPLNKLKKKWERRRNE